jgi:hypothetical protein
LQLLVEERDKAKSSVYRHLWQQYVFRHIPGHENS